MESTNGAESTALLVLSSLGETSRHIVYGLSACLSVKPTELYELVSQAWAEGEDDLSRSIDLVLHSPIAEETSAGWRVADALEGPILQHFIEEDESTFRRIRLWLAEKEVRTIEQMGQSSPIEMERWLAKARLAFYLVDVQVEEAVEQFADAFESAPAGEAKRARSWLSSLAIRQASALREFGYVLSFFEGFRLYVAGQRASAERKFRQVVEEGHQDLYRAISLHLHALCLSTRSRRRIHDLEMSVALSQQLDLIKNEVMARNSLVSAYWSRADRIRLTSQKASESYLRRSLREAKTNLERASGLHERTYYAYALIAHAISQWLVTAGLAGRRARSRKAQDLAPEVIDQLRLAVREGGAFMDTSLVAANYIACIFRDTGQTEESLDELEVALAKVNEYTDPRVVTRLVKTASSIRVSLPVQLAKRHTLMTGGLRDWQARLASVDAGGAPSQPLDLS